ncbi:class I SAM-dependent methyltransferase [Conexibacter sp. DBS9H8]|uniref:class I SAM-dependent methyltransferase n=1 Tax=Conexibacter sp. DBS9H8 TaxID=2937801 RepID=UPI00200FAEF6|nr:class I SAM-dependent methyltransferase [Conexibacter sp. DBS9H8]
MTDDLREELLDSWEQAAPGWARQAERWAEAVAPVTEAMLSAAGLAPGTRVLELAAGPGDLSRRAAPTVAPTAVLCTDAVRAMVDVARELNEDGGPANIVFQTARLEWIDLPAATVDVILCRFGLMHAVDPETALRECRRVLTPGGRLVLAVQAAAVANRWLTLPLAAAATLGLGAGAPDTPAQGADGGPGPFALAEPGVLEELIGAAGFGEISLWEVPFLWCYRDERDWIGEKLDHSPSFAALWRSLDDAQRSELRRRLRELASAERGGDGSFSVSGRAVLATARA